MPSELLKQKWKEFEDSPSAKAWRKTWTEYWKHNLLVPPQVFDFLRTMQVDLATDEETPKEYTIYTRKVKGSEVSNPSFKVDQKMFDAITVVISNLKSSIILPSPEIRFFKDTGELRIWGFHVYIKRGSDRAVLCEYLFGGDEIQEFWEVEDLVVALRREYDPKHKKKHFDWVNRKILELNKDVEVGIGFEKFIVPEAGNFKINAFNIPVIN